MAADRPVKKMKLTAAPVSGTSIKTEPVDGTVADADPDLEIVFVKNEIVIQPPVTWQHRIAITEAEKAEKEKQLDEIRRAREAEEKRIAEVAARAKEIEDREEAICAKKARQALLVSKLQAVLGAKNVLGRLGDLVTYSDIKYRGAVERSHKNWRGSIVVRAVEIEASCREYINAEGYAEEYFRVISRDTWQPMDMRSLASETVKLADDIYKVLHDDTTTQEMILQMMLRLYSGVVFCKSDKEAADLSASSKYPIVWGTYTWAGKWRKGEHRDETRLIKPPPESTIAIEEAKVKKLAGDKARLKEELAKLKNQNDKTTLEVKDAEKEVDRLDYMIVVKKDYCAANASWDVPLNE